ncbi:MAG: phosphoesterase [Deltaproteobacteria bacterium]|nr:MAG: phosphoesterase [Deltaproteobacteria bacterium]
MSVSNSERLRRFFEKFDHGDQVLIMINADPDAIASAMAVKRLLWRKVAGVSITHINVIKRPDNLAMIKLLGVDLVHVDDIDESLFNRFVILDSQPDHHEYFSRFKPDVVIDHHPVTSAIADFSDIRPQYGATATILTEYLRAAKIKPSVKLATALYHAIKTDTGNFGRKTIIEDIRAFQFLYRHANIHISQTIENGEIRFDFLKYFERALQNKILRKCRLFAHLDHVINPDVCVLVADFFIRVDTATWSIISGVYNKKLIIIFRNADFRRNAGKLAKAAFASLGSAGGHKNAARAEIPLSVISGYVDVRDMPALSKWIIHQVEKGAIGRRTRR